MGTNIFLDAGYRPDDATVMAVRSDLATQIAEFLKRGQLNQVAAARLLNVPQPTISKIVNGRVQSLSIELLLRMLVRANVPVVIQTGSNVQDAGAYVAVGRPLADATASAKVRPTSYIIYGDFQWQSPGDLTAGLPPVALKNRSGDVAT
jgi:predicted XRE-type DNA-binding protein